MAEKKSSKKPEKKDNKKMVHHVKKHLQKEVKSLIDKDPTEYRQIVILVGIIFLPVSLMLIIGAIGLIRKLPIGHLLISIVYTGLIILVFPFLIVLLLNEKEVKERFKRKSK